MRKILLTIIAGTMLTSFVACQSGEGDSKATNAALNTNSQYTAGDATPGTGDIGEQPADGTPTASGTVLSEAAMKWVTLHGDENKVFMTAEQIQADNQRIVSASDKVYDITAVPQSYSKLQLRNKIEGATPPSLPKYDDSGKAITQDNYNAILANRNVNGLSDTNAVRRGIVVSRAYVRRVPSSIGMFNSPDNPYDRNQDTELYVGSPVWVLHTSTDGEFYYIQSYYYSGWVTVTSIAVTDDSALWESFAKPQSFGVVTEALLTIGGSKYDMGAILPISSKDNVNFTVTTPVRNADGTLSTGSASVSRVHMNEGYLPYTFKNFVAQAFKYEGTMYGWGGLNDGVDCSSFVASVYRSFGFMLPRDTGDQESTVGKHINVNGKSHAEIAAILDSTTAPTVVYYSGHTLLYLGHEGGSYSFIHAPSMGQAVQTTIRTDLSGIRYVNEVTP